MEDYFFSSRACFYLICSRLRGASAEKPACDGPLLSNPVKTRGDNCSGTDSNDMTFVALLNIGATLSQRKVKLVFNHKSQWFSITTRVEKITGAQPGSMVTGGGVAKLAFHRDKVFSHDDNIFM